MNIKYSDKDWVIKIFKKGQILYTFVICKADKERIPENFNKIVIRVDQIKQMCNDQV